jgi:hypothetical protein
MMKGKPFRLTFDDYDVVDRGHTTPCWIWRGKQKDTGYATMTVPTDGPRGRPVRAHRAFYERHVGPVPEGHDLDHLCRVRNCVNPAHLEPVTRRENLRRGTGFIAVHARKTHCPRGHEYDAVDNRGQRFCRQCARVLGRERNRRYDARRKAQEASA